MELKEQMTRNRFQSVGEKSRKFHVWCRLLNEFFFVLPGFIKFSLVIKLYTDPF